MSADKKIRVREVAGEEVDKLIELQANHTNPSTYFCVTRDEFVESLELDRVWVAFAQYDEGSESENTESEELVAFALVIKNRESVERNLCSDVGKPFDEVATFDAVVVDERFRGRGLHRKFLELAEEYARENGARYLAATVSPENTFSRRNFEKMGFEVVAEKVKYNGVMRLIFCKEI